MYYTLSGKHQLEVYNHPQLVKIAALHSCIMKVKAELDQFVAGLKEAQVLDVIRKYPSFFHPMFVASQTDTVTAGIS